MKNHVDWSILPKIAERLSDKMQMKIFQVLKDNFKYLIKHMKIF
jgi:hypothetical protein